MISNKQNNSNPITEGESLIYCENSYLITNPLGFTTICKTEYVGQYKTISTLNSTFITVQDDSNLISLNFTFIIDQVILSSAYIGSVLNSKNEFYFFLSPVFSS